MKTYPWILFSAGILSIAFAEGACGGGGSGGSAGSGTGGHTATVSSSSSSTSGNMSSSSSSGGGTDCTGIVDNTTACGMCLEGSCCMELSDCSADTDCNDCLFTGNQTDPTVCSGNAAVGALQTCLQSKCDVCVPKSECNPVTNEGCPSDGSACDLNSQGVYVCFGPPNPTALCGMCTNTASGPYCKPGLHCTDPDGNGGQCTAFCCDDGDCGANGTCDKTNLVENVGVCVPKAGTTDAGPTAGVCDSPATPPSGGSCFTLPGKDGG